jgi:hypothetical protein
MKAKNELPKTKNDRWRQGIWAGMLALALGLGGCAGQNALERDFGHANASNIAQQTVNPAAGMTVASPTVGLPPKAAVNAMERYDKSFKGEEKAATSLKMISGY